MTGLVLLAVTGTGFLLAVLVATWLILAGRPRRDPHAEARREPTAPARLAPTLPAQVWQPRSPAFPPSQPGPRLGWSETGWWAQEADAFRRRPDDDRVDPAA